METLKTNFNNPSDLNLSNSYSTVSATLDNPFFNKQLYGNFGSADPVLQEILPKKINLGPNNGNNNNQGGPLNLGLTSPGTVLNSMDCSGLDFVNTNPSYDNLTFQMCLDKFNDEYRIPYMTFNNLLKNLPYTFSALNEHQKRHYLHKISKFLDLELNKLNHKEKFENFENKNENENFENKNENFNENFDDAPNSSSNLPIILCLVLLIIILVTSVLFIANKK